MNNLFKSGGNDIINLLHNKGGQMDIARPFEHEIFLFDTYIAGTSHIEGIIELEPNLNVDDKLDFFRETDNAFDNKAIMVKNSDGIKLGYIPEKDNLIFARLMDAGKLLFGKISDKEVRHKWVKIQIKVYLHE